MIAPWSLKSPSPAARDDIETKLSAVAHHEAGHTVIAAAVGLRRSN